MTGLSHRCMQDIYMGHRALKQNTIPPNLFVVRTPQQLLDAMSSGASHIEIRAHLDLRTVEPLISDPIGYNRVPNNTMLVFSTMGSGQVIWVRIRCTVLSLLIHTKRFRVTSAALQHFQHLSPWHSIDQGHKHSPSCTSIHS